VRGVRLARSWSAEPPRQVWRQPIGAGWSSFAIVGQAAITQEQRGDNEMIVCYEVPTGRALWHHSNRVRFTETQGGDGPRATPTISGGKVYVLGATGILDCLDGATGKLLWTHDTLKEHSAPNLYWGKSSSPLIVDDLVVISGGDSEGPSLLAYHRDTGIPAWRAGQFKSSYASPMLTTLGGRRQIVMVNGTSVTGHDPATGETLWTYSWPGDWPKCSQPVVLDNDRVFLSAGYQVGCVLLKIEMTKPQEERVAEIWKNNNLRAQFTDVVAHAGFLYGIDDAILVCLDPATGKRTWKGERYGHGQILLVDDLILVQSEPGEIVLVEANSNQHRELGRFPALSDKTWNVPALSGPYLLVRNDREAACYKLPVQRVTQR
jgi:outer membrane protein assembly factor BamB